MPTSLLHTTCPKFSAWWVVYKVNPHEQLPIPSDNSCYHACNLEDDENYGIVQEDDLPTSFNVEISEGLDSLVIDPNDVEVVVMKRKRAPARKHKKKKKIKWRPWGTRRQLDPNFDDNSQVCLLHIMFPSYFAHFILCFFHILLISFQY
jgi:hypothetical protein